MKITNMIKELKENNEKILKRFQFDLEMGIFYKDVISRTGEEIYYFDHIDKSKFVRVLEDLGYKYSESKVKIYDKPQGLAVTKKSKKYWLCYYSFHWFPVENNVNLIPNYIFEYSKCPLLDVMKETLHDIFKRNKDK